MAVFLASQTKNRSHQAYHEFISNYTYRPDFDPRFGYYKTVQTDTSGTTRQLSIYDGFRYGAPTLGEAAGSEF